MKEVETDGKEGASVDTKLADGNMNNSEGSEVLDDTEDLESRVQLTN